jgi:hypothetical protein
MTLAAPRQRCHCAEMQAGMSEKLRELTVPKCFELLATAKVGHLAITYRALPVVVPVRIHLGDGYLVLESAFGNVIPVSAGGVAALEAGLAGADLVTQWSVEVRGFLTAETGERVGFSSERFTSDPMRFHLSTDEVSGRTATRSAPVTPLGVARARPTPHCCART